MGLAKGLPAKGLNHEKQIIINAILHGLFDQLVLHGGEGGKNTLLPHS